MIDWDALPASTPQPGVEARRFDGAAMTVVEYRFAAGAAGYPLHRHPEEQLVQVLEGTLDFTVAGVVTRLGPGQSAYVAGGVEHGARPVGGTGARFLNIVAPRRP